MHTVFRVYGNAIGRTALCSRTVGSGFKSVVRMKGEGIDPDRPLGRKPNKWKDQLIEADNKMREKRSMKRGEQENLAKIYNDLNTKYNEEEKEIENAEKKDKAIDAERKARAELKAVEDKALKKAAKKAAKDKKRGDAAIDAERKARAAQAKAKAPAPVPAVVAPGQVFDYSKHLICSICNCDKTYSTKQSFNTHLLSKKHEDKKAAKDKAEAEAEVDADAESIPEANPDNDYEDVVESEEEEDEEKAAIDADAESIPEANPVNVYEDVAESEEDEDEEKNDVVEADGEKGEIEVYEPQRPNESDDEYYLKLHNQIRTQTAASSQQPQQPKRTQEDEDTVEAIRESLKTLQKEVDTKKSPRPVPVANVPTPKNVENNMYEDSSSTYESESEDEKKFDSALKALGRQFGTLQDEILKIKDKKDPLRIKKVAKLVQLGKDMDKIRFIDQGFEEDEKISVVWNELKNIKFDNEIIYSKMDGVFDLTFDDFNLISEKFLKDKSRPENIKRNRIMNGIMSVLRSNEYLKNHPILKESNKRVLYEKHKTEKDVNGKSKLLSTIEPSKKFEMGMCGDAQGKNEYMDELLGDENNNFETTDSFCINNDIKGSTMTPIDLYSKSKKRMLEAKYYKNKLNFVKMFNCNMLRQKEYYEELKKQLRVVLDDIIINQLKNIIDNKLITKQAKLLQILKTKNDFLRSYYTNFNYQSVNISSNKWGVATTAVPIANTKTQIKNFIKHANTKITVKFKNCKISKWTVKEGSNQKEINKKYKKLLFSNIKRFSYEYYIGTMFRQYLGIYDHTHDTLLNGFKHIIEVYKIGPASDQHFSKKVKGIKVTVQQMNAVKIPVENFFISGMFAMEPYPILSEPITTPIKPETKKGSKKNKK